MVCNPDIRITLGLTSLANWGVGGGGRQPFNLLSLELISLTAVNKAEQMHIGSDYMASIPQYID